MSFDLLSDRLQGELETWGFTGPTPPQKLSIPAVLDGQDALVISPTGSGKTEAAMLPVLDDLLHTDSRIGALYITPLKALNRDMLSRMEGWAESLGLDVRVRHGDTTQYERRKQALDPPHVLITTPETLQAILTGSRLRGHLSNVTHVVVDEVHELAASKRGVQLSIGLERLRDLAGPFRRIGLSATVGNPDEVAAFLGGRDRDVRVLRADDRKGIELEVRKPCGKPLKNLSKEQSAHLRGIADAVRDSEATLIFVNTRQFAEVLANRFKRYRDRLGVDVDVHHGSLSKEARLDVEDRFKSGELDGLICTSSLELGIDVGHVDRVVQYMSPRQVSRLLQRVGRSGHSLGKTSHGTVIASTPDEVAESLIITEKALTGGAENIETPNRALDVLANQVVGELVSTDASPDDTFTTFRRAHPYRDLDRSTFDDVVNQLRDNRLLARDSFKQTGKAYTYFYQNLSTIPDEKTYCVRNRVSGGTVGTLDEAFVTGFLEPGTSFICRGETWRVLEIHDDSLDVEPLRDPSSAVPSWVGEEIPVPWDVAQSVGKLRHVVAESLRNGDDPVPLLTDRFPVDPDTAEVLVNAVRTQLGGGHPVPTDRCVTVENHGDTVVINAAFGHRVNEAIGRAVSSLLAARLGSSVGLEAGPYRISLTVPVTVRAAEARDILRGLEPESIAPILSASLKNSTLFRWVLLHVAKRFGAISKDADRGKVSLKRIADTYYATPMGDEAIRDILQERLDVHGAEHALALLHSGDVELAISKPSPLGRPEDKVSGMVEAEKPDLSILKALKKRIQEDRVILFCLTCTDWTSRRRVHRVPDQPECPRCGSRLVAALKPWEGEEIELYRKGPTTKEERKRVQRVEKNANLVLSSGRRGVIALAARGVGPRNASLVLRKTDADEWEFYRRILDRERHYARTHSFWG